MPEQRVKTVKFDVMQKGPTKKHGQSKSVAEEILFSPIGKSCRKGYMFYRP